MNRDVYGVHEANANQQSQGNTGGQLHDISLQPQHNVSSQWIVSPEPQTVNQQASPQSSNDQF